MRTVPAMATVLLALLLTFATASGALAQSRIVNQSDGAAIKGYDAVAYFTESNAIEGDPAFSHVWNDATWLFKTAANRDAFAAAPEKYAPQYGGYCAYAMSRNYVADITPTAWMIVDGRLYLNNSRAVHLWWLADQSGNIASADANWPGQQEKLAE